MSDQTQTGAEGSELASSLPMVRPEAFPRFREIIKASEGREWSFEEFADLHMCLTPEGRAKIREALSLPARKPTATEPSS